MGSLSSKRISTNRLDGKTAIITGCNTGIGKATAEDFYRRGARVLMACRNKSKAVEAAEDIIYACQNVPNLGQIAITLLNLSSFRAIRKCAEKILERESRIDLLINNAAIMACPYGETEDGFELQFGTNHLGHFLFTLLLLPKIIKSAPARIVNLSSLFNEYGALQLDDLNWNKRPYNPVRAYAQSKLGNVLFAKELAAKLQEHGIEGVTTYSLHPGVVATDWARYSDGSYFMGALCLFDGIRVCLKTPHQGAQTTIYCAIDDQAGKETGLYYVDSKAANPGSNALKMDDAKKLWDVSLNLVGLGKNYNPFHD